MNEDQIQGLARNILMTLGGWMVGKGWVDTPTMTAIVGGLIALGSWLWSHRHIGKLSN